MSEPFIAEIQLFAGTYPPRGWAFCDGSLLSIASNTALFALIGTQFGGDGRTTFALPDLRGRVPVGAGRGDGLSPRFQSQRGGAEAIHLVQSEMSAHSHTPEREFEVQVRATTTQGTVVDPAANSLIASGFDKETRLDMENFASAPTGTVDLGGVQASADLEIAPTGSGAAHDNMGPWQAMNYIIALIGLFPSRN